MIFEPVIYKKTNTSTIVEGIVPVSLTIDKPPNKTEYFVGDTFDPTGIEVWVNFSNGKSLFALESDLSFAPTEISDTSTDKVTVTFSWGETSVSIEQKITIKQELELLVWNKATIPTTGVVFHSLYGADKFVAIISGENKSLSSNDGILWKENTMPSSAPWDSVAYGNNKFVAISNGINNAPTAVAAYSADGENWDSISMPTAALWVSITYGEKFVAVSDDGKYAYSNSGTSSWSYGSLPKNQNILRIAYGNGKYIVTTSNDNKFFVSSDASTWSTITVPVSGVWAGITYGNDKFVAVAKSSDNVCISEDGLNWTAYKLPETGTWSSVAYGNGIYVIVGWSLDYCLYSLDGINWSKSSLPSNETLQTISYGLNRFVSLGIGGMVIYSNEISR